MGHLNPSDIGPISKEQHRTFLPKGREKYCESISILTSTAKHNCCYIPPLFTEHCVQDMNEQSISYYSAHLSVCNILPVNQTEWLHANNDILTIVMNLNARGSSWQGTNIQTKKNSHAQVSVGLMWHLFVKLSGKTAEIRWRINIRCEMGHRSQRGPRWAVYCKMGQRWQVHHTLLNPSVLDELEIYNSKNANSEKPFDICYVRGLIL